MFKRFLAVPRFFKREKHLVGRLVKVVLPMRLRDRGGRAQRVVAINLLARCARQHLSRHELGSESGPDTGQDIISRLI